MATHTVGEHPAAPKIRTLLALAASAVKVGSLGEAAAAGNAARKIADEAGLLRGYVDVDSRCQFTREHMIETSRILTFVKPTAALQWQECKAYATNTFGRIADPETYSITGVIATGEINKHGAHVLLTDWSDTHPATNFEPRALT